MNPSRGGASDPIFIQSRCLNLDRFTMGLEFQGLLVHVSRGFHSGLLGILDEISNINNQFICVTYILLSLFFHSHAIWKQDSDKPDKPLAWLDIAFSFQGFRFPPASKSNPSGVIADNLLITNYLGIFLCIVSGAG